MKPSQKTLMPIIPADLARIVGEIVIRCGELERAIFTAIARVTRKTEEEFITELGEQKTGTPLGNIIRNAEGEFDTKYGWFDPKELKVICDERNFIHDALMQNENGSYVWQSSSKTSSKKRKHRPIDFTWLCLLRSKIELEIAKIDDGSLKYKMEQIGKEKNK